MVLVWEPGSEVEPVVLRGHQGWVRSVAVGHVSGRDVVVSAGQDGTVRVWELGSEVEPVVLRGHQGWAWSIALGRLPGRDVVVMGGADGKVRVWEPSLEADLMVLSPGSVSNVCGASRCGLVDTRTAARRAWEGP
jgi:WD40 repeat protein